MKRLESVQERLDIEQERLDSEQERLYREQEKLDSEQERLKNRLASVVQWSRRRFWKRRSLVLILGLLFNFRGLFNLNLR